MKRTEPGSITDPAEKQNIGIQVLLEKRQKKRHYGDREDAKDRGKKDAVRAHLLLFSMDLGHVQDDGRAGYGAQDKKACLKGIRHRKDECDRKRQ